ALRRGRRIRGLRDPCRHHVHCFAGQPLDGLRRRARPTGPGGGHARPGPGLTLVPESPTTTTTRTAYHLLRRDGLSVLVDVTNSTLPRVLHWGPDLGPLDEAALAALAGAIESAVPR